MKANLTRVIGLGLTVVFLVLAFQRVDLSGFVEELKNVKYMWLLPSAGCTLLGYALPGLGLALVTINLGIMVPSGPGYVGTQEFFGTAALGVVGANPQAALALVVVSHAIQHAVVTGLGLIFFAREQLSPRDLRPALAEQIS